jgi:hypothetical protein
MVCSMNKAKPPAADLVIASDPELVRLDQRIRSLQDLAESRLVEAEALSKEPDRLMDTFDRFIQLSDEVRRAIAQAHTLRQRYQRRHQKLEAERARRLASARVAFLAAGSPPAGTRH